MKTKDTWLVRDQKEAVENSSTTVCSTSQASFVDVVQTAYAGWSWRLALETSRTKASEDRQRLNSFSFKIYDGKTFNSEKILELW